MTDWGKLRVEVKAKYRAAAKVAHPDTGGSVEEMAEVNVAYADAMQTIDRREQEELAQTQAQPKDRVNGSASSSWANQFSTVPNRRRSLGSIPTR
ncbi:MAG: hypothetical protein ACR2GC_01060 [Methyloceanibacter sp.]|uniref:hypothetical protein n=1 Tax=Methyloceanibacter sp. TaxID=1965321 RepID=UPI003D9BD666